MDSLLTSIPFQSTHELAQPLYEALRKPINGSQPPPEHSPAQAAQGEGSQGLVPTGTASPEPTPTPMPETMDREGGGGDGDVNVGVVVAPIVAAMVLVLVGVLATSSFDATAPSNASARLWLWQRRIRIRCVSSCETPPPLVTALERAAAANIFGVAHVLIYADAQANFPAVVSLWLLSSLWLRQTSSHVASCLALTIAKLAQLFLCCRPNASHPKLSMHVYRCQEIIPTQVRNLHYTMLMPEGALGIPRWAQTCL